MLIYFLIINLLFLLFLHGCCFTPLFMLRVYITYHLLQFQQHILIFYYFLNWSKFLLFYSTVIYVKVILTNYGFFIFFWISLAYLKNSKEIAKLCRPRKYKKSLKFSLATCCQYIVARRGFISFIYLFYLEVWQFATF